MLDRKPAGFLWTVLTISIVFIQGGCHGAQVDVEPREILVLPGQNVTVMCRVAVPLQYCRVEIPGMDPFNLNSKLNNPRVSYAGSGLNAGQCGFTINSVTERNNGEIRCMLGIETEFTESTGSTHLIVAKTPRVPELDLSRGTDHLRLYKVNDELQASCIVRDGRPVANITWFLDDEPLNRDGLSMPTVIDMAKENLQSKLQNLTRILQPSDNGKFLRCIALHPAYPNGRAETKRQLDVKYGPIPQSNMDKFGFVLGQPGVISVEIQANPKPQVEWDIGGERLGESDTDSTGRLASEFIRELGNGRYLFNLRLATVKKEDTEKDYVIRAYNDQGKHDYVIKIWTSPEPEGVEMGVGGIIGVVVAVLVVLLVVFLLIFARITGRWCFSGREELATTTDDGSPADPETAEPHRSRLRRFPPLFSLNLFKRRSSPGADKDRVASATDEPPAYYDAIAGVDETKETKDPLAKSEEGEGVVAPSAVANNTDGAAVGVGNNREEGLVYAELDLVNAMNNVKAVVKNDDDKTEYAEIVYSPNEGGDETSSAAAATATSPGANVK